MRSSLPFFVKPMRKLISKGVSRDYRIGLNLLNLVLDPKRRVSVWNFPESKTLKASRPFPDLLPGAWAG